MPPGSEHLLDVPHLLTRLIAETALTREESRGSHFRADFPSESEALRASRRPAIGLRARARDMAVATDTLERIVHAALAEDIGAGRRHDRGDRRRAGAVGTAELLVKEAGVVCGLRAAESDVPRARPGRPLRARWRATATPSNRPPWSRASRDRSARS